MEDALFGMETELAFSAWTSGLAIACDDRGHLIQDLFRLAEQRLVSLPDQHAPGLYLENGARFYLDAGHHPEFCTPECRSPEEVVRWQLAGERILAELGEELEKLHDDTRVALFRCNVDYSGNGETWGCHESYQYRCDATQMSLHLLPHLASRIVFTGAGGLNNRGRKVEFLLSPRVPHLLNDEASGSQSARGLYHTKNEPLGSGGFSRLHLICGESNSSQQSTYLKFGTTALIVRLIDAGVCRGNELRFVRPRVAMNNYAKDPTCQAVGRLRDGRRLRAVEVQREFLSMVERHLDDDFMPAWAPQVCTRWRQVLDALDSDPSSLSTSLDWSIKYALFQDRIDRAGTSWDQLSLGHGLAAELCEIDTRFGELGTRGLFHALDRAGVLDHRIPELGSVEEAMTSAPAGGRAEVRSRAIRGLQADRKRYRCYWERINDNEEDRMYDMREPFGRSPRWRKSDIRSSRSSPSEVALRRMTRQLEHGISLYHGMQFTDASQALETMASTARTSGNHEIEALARFWWATAQLDLGRLQGAEQALTPILESIDHHVSNQTACRVQTRYALVLIDKPAEVSEIEKLLEGLRIHLELSEDGTGRSRVSMVEGRFQGMLGNLDEAIEIMGRALREERTDFISFSRSSYYRWLVTFLLRTNKIDHANAYLVHWREELQNGSPVLHERIALSCAESNVARLRGEISAALAHAQSAVAHACRREPNRSRLNAFCVLIESAVAADEIEMAGRYVAKLAEFDEIEVGAERAELLRVEQVFRRACSTRSPGFK